MKKRLIQCAILFLCLFILPGTKVFAQEKQSLEQFAGTDELWEHLPEEIDEQSIRTLLDDKDSENFTKSIFQKFLSLFSIGLQRGRDFFIKLCALILFAALFQAVKDSFGFKSGGEAAFDFLLLLILSLITYSALGECLELALVTLESIHTFILSSLPVTTVLLTLSGAPTAAGTMASGISFTIAMVSTLLSKILAPLVNTLFAFSMADGILSSSLNGLINWLKKSAKILCILFFTIISASLGIKHALASAADSTWMRTVRFAAGTFIPVVGSLLGESSKTLAASFVAVKTECGILFVLVLLYLLLRPILTIAAQKVFLSLAAALAEILNVKNVQGYLKSISGLFDLLMALLISEGCYLFFYVTLFITNRGGV